jgi:hypothetical protein
MLKATERDFDRSAFCGISVLCIGRESAWTPPHTQGRVALNALIEAARGHSQHPVVRLWPKPFQAQACTMIGRCLAAVWQ